VYGLFYYLHLCFIFSFQVCFKCVLSCIYSMHSLGIIMRKFRENLVFFPKCFHFLLSKWANYSPILIIKKWENFGKNTKFSRNFPMFFPSVDVQPSWMVWECVLFIWIGRWIHFQPWSKILRPPLMTLGFSVENLRTSPPLDMYL